MIGESDGTLTINLFFVAIPVWLEELTFQIKNKILRFVTELFQIHYLQVQTWA
jgi:hypothetical protein